MFSNGLLYIDVPMLNNQQRPSYINFGWTLNATNGLMLSSRDDRDGWWERERERERERALGGHRDVMIFFTHICDPNSLLLWVRMEVYAVTPTLSKLYTRLMRFSIIPWTLFWEGFKHPAEGSTQCIRGPFNTHKEYNSNIRKKIKYIF